MLIGSYGLKLETFASCMLGYTTRGLYYVGAGRPSRVGNGLKQAGWEFRASPSVGGDIHQYDVAPPSIKWLGGGASWWPLTTTVIVFAAPLGGHHFFFPTPAPDRRQSTQLSPC